MIFYPHPPERMYFGCPFTSSSSPRRVFLLFASCCALYIFLATCVDKLPDGVLDNEQSLLEEESEIHANMRHALQIVLSGTRTSEKVAPISEFGLDSRNMQGFLQCLIKHRALPTQFPVSNLLNASEPEMAMHKSGSVCIESADMSRITQQWNVNELCSHLLTKRILLVGSRTTYRLHDKLIDMLSFGAQPGDTQPRCLGATMCTWHEICTSVEGLTTDSVRRTPLMRHKTPPRNLNASSILRFAFAATLRPYPLAIPVPYVSPLTGVREHDAPDWPNKARRSDLLVFAKTPVPVPAWAYDNVSEVNIAVHLPNPESSLWKWALPLLGVGRYNGAIGAAWKATAVKWLPELMETLVFLSENATGEGKLVIWLGQRYFEEGCVWPGGTLKGESYELQFKQLLRSSMSARCVFLNVQVYIQNVLLREILPHFGHTFIPGANPAPSHMNTTSHSSGPQVALQASLSSLVNASLSDTHEITADEVFLNGLITILRWRNESSRKGGWR